MRRSEPCRRPGCPGSYHYSGFVTDWEECPMEYYDLHTCDECGDESLSYIEPGTPIEPERRSDPCTTT